jgi:hypothetical protein
MGETVSKRERRLEIFSAVLMSLATVATAWCAYQSAEWGGEQAFMLGESQRDGRRASVQEALAAQKRSLDVSIFMEWIGAVATDNEPLREFYDKRFPPNLRTAVEAWLATEPRTNADAPPHPFVMPEYRVAQDSLAAEASAASAEKWRLAREYDMHGDRYVLLTVVFASVLFFGGISEKFDHLGVRLGVLMMGSILFTAALGTMLTYPVWL